MKHEVKSVSRVGKNLILTAFITHLFITLIIQDKWTVHSPSSAVFVVAAFSVTIPTIIPSVGKKRLRSNKIGFESPLSSPALNPSFFDNLILSASDTNDDEPNGRQLFELYPLPDPPGPALQNLNALIHKKNDNDNSTSAGVVSLLVYGMYWTFVLGVCCPVAALGLSIATVYRIATTVADNMKERDENETEGDGYEYGVVITGCDSGFGRLLVEAFVEDERFVIFAGCLQQESVDSFTTSAGDQRRVIPMLMDVTSDDQVQDVARIVRNWVEDGGRQNMVDDQGRQRKRSLHAIVNNAGIGLFGLVDWFSIDDYRKVMEVNFFGFLRITKAFLPQLKQQAASSPSAPPLVPRIINVGSLAGMLGPISGASPYVTSKYAAEGLTAVLREELKLYNVAMVSVNPSFHETPLVELALDDFSSQWTGMSKELREDYGKDYFEVFSNNFIAATRRTRWEANVVVRELVDCVRRPVPRPQVIVGSDAKFSGMVLRMLPVWLIDYLSSLSLSDDRPASMQRVPIQKTGMVSWW